MKKLIWTFLAICAMGSMSSAFAEECGCQGDAEQCTCAECNCPPCN